jgi:hypothetical protein
MARVSLEKKTTVAVMTPFSKVPIEVEAEDADALKHASDVLSALDHVVGFSMTNLFNQMLTTAGELDNAQGNDQVRP